MSHISFVFGELPTIRFSRAINLTNRHVGLYDTVGNIAVCDPGCHADLLDELKPDIMVIVADDSDAKAFGIPEENAVRVQSCDIGRNGNRVSRLSRLCDDALVKFAPAAVSFGTPEVYHV